MESKFLDQDVDVVVGILIYAQTCIETVLIGKCADDLIYLRTTSEKVCTLLPL